MHPRAPRFFRLIPVVFLPLVGCAEAELVGTDFVPAEASESVPDAEPESGAAATKSAVDPQTPRGDKGPPRLSKDEASSTVTEMSADLANVSKKPRRVQKVSAKSARSVKSKPKNKAPRGAVKTDAPQPVVGATPAQDGTFESAGVNPFVTTDHDRHSTFAIDVDTGSYTYALGLSRRGRQPAQAAVRVEEWMNAFHYDYQGPTDDAPFAVHMQAAPSPFNALDDDSTGLRHVLRIGIQGRRVTNEARNPAHLTMLVDVSGSMSASNKLPLAKTAMRELVNNLRSDDYVAIVTYAGRTEEHLPTTSCDDKATILRAIDTLRTGGGTNMGSGMDLAFRNAGMHLATGVTSRVVVMSDGDANIGRTRHETILEAVRGYVSEGVTLSTVGLGNGNYNDHLMEQLADAGNGNYSYIDSAETAKRVFGTDLVANLQVIAQDVKVQVEFNPEFVRDYRLIGYENRNVADHDFRNDKRDAGELGAGHSVTALYEMTLHPSRETPRGAVYATVRLRHKTPRHARATETEQTFSADELLPHLEDADADTRQALAVALVAEYLRGSPYANRAVAHAGLALLPSEPGAHPSERAAFHAMATTLVAPRPHGSTLGAVKGRDAPFGDAPVRGGAR